jgi:membrane protein YqaA with SNARE-associated domain
MTWGVAAAFGEMAAYAIGRLSGHASFRKRMVRVRKGLPAHTLYFVWARQIKRRTDPGDWTSKYGFWAIPIFAFSPLPMDLLGLVLGYLRYNPGKFFLGSLIGKVPRSLLLAYGMPVFAKFLDIPFYWLIILGLLAFVLVTIASKRIRA